RSPYAHGVTRDPARRGWAQHRAGLDVVNRPVPRARDLLARHLALGERAAAVRAGVVDGVEAPLQVEEGDLLPRRLDALRLARSEVGGARNLDELRHVDLLANRLPRSELDHDPPGARRSAPPGTRLRAGDPNPKDVTRPSPVPRLAHGSTRSGRDRPRLLPLLPTLHEEPPVAPRPRSRPDGRPSGARRWRLRGARGRHRPRSR